MPARVAKAQRRAPPDGRPAVRAARIVRLFTSEDDRINRAIRVAVTSQSTRKRCLRLETLRRTGHRAHPAREYR